MTTTALPPLHADGAGPLRSLYRASVIGLLAFLTVVDLFATQSILPVLTLAYGVTPAQMGLAVNSSTLGMAVASITIAVFSSRIERRSGIMVSLAGLAVPTLLLAVAPNLVSFALLRMTQGLFMASAFTLTLAYLGEHLRPAETAGAFAAYITGNVASNLFGRVASAALVDTFGLEANFLVFAALNLSGALLAYFAVERLRPVRANGLGGRSILATAQHLKVPALAAGFAIGFCILFAFIGTFTYVNFVLAGPPIGLSMMALGLVYVVFLPSIVTTPAAGAVVRRFGVRPALWSGLAVAGAGLPLLLAGTLPPIAVGLCLAAVGTFFAQAVTTGFIGRAASVDRGGASGIYLACYFTGGLVGTAVIGTVFESFGWPASVTVIAIAVAIAALLARWLKLPDS